MTFHELYQDVHAWIAQKHPQYREHTICSVHNEVDIGEKLPYEIAQGAQQALRDHGDLIADDFKDVFSRVVPPEGSIFVTLRHEGTNERVCFLVPRDLGSISQ